MPNCGRCGAPFEWGVHGESESEHSHTKDASWTCSKCGQENVWIGVIEHIGERVGVDVADKEDEPVS